MSIRKLFGLDAPSKTRQDGNTGQMILDVPRIVARVSNAFTLESGNLILTGTPSGVGVFRDPPLSMQPGGTVEVEIERMGTLTSPVVADR